MIDTCKVCSTNELYRTTNLYDDRYGYPGTFDLLKCCACGHTFTKTNFSSEQLIELYSTFYPRSSFDICQYKAHQETKGFKSWLNGETKSAYRWIPHKVRILDIGCGFGESLGYHTARGCDVYGVEADKNIQKVVDKFGFNVHIGLFTPELYEPEFFDYVTMDQVIEHMTDPLTTLRGVARVLKQDGIAVLSTPNANGWGAKLFGKKWINWHTPYHVQFFSQKSMQVAAENAGLKVKEVKTITSSEWLLYQWIHLATFPQQSAPSAFWDTKTEQKFRVKLLINALAVTHKSKINHIITRLFDSLGLGDNFLFILVKS